MADKIKDIVDELVAKDPFATLYQAVQAGMTAGAVSMRTRAMVCVDAPVHADTLQNDLNKIKNSIGQLADIA